MPKTDDEIYEFCKSWYYDEGLLWEVFAGYTDGQIEHLIRSDVRRMKEFLAEH